MCMGRKSSACVDWNVECRFEILDRECDCEFECEFDKLPLSCDCDTCDGPFPCDDCTCEWDMEA